MRRKHSKNTDFPTLKAWMDGTGTPAFELARRCKISQGHLSNIRNRKRTCSLPVAIRIHTVTRVPMQSLLRPARRIRPGRGIPSPAVLHDATGSAT